VRHVVLVTIDTLRADRVGAYGYAAARTPHIDALARGGSRFDLAFATAPVTLPSHASLMTGRYPAGHGARHNGIRIDMQTPTLAESFARSGFATGGFVAAFPLDRRFGLIKGFQTYGDSLPRGPGGRVANERPGRAVVDEALAWAAAHRADRVFLWVHLFEPHAPYGNPADPAQAARPVSARYDDDVAEADVQVGRLVSGLGLDRTQTLFVVAGDHGEAFGEHGEISHSLFVYDTTLRVPLIVAGPGVAAGEVIRRPVSLVDVAPTIAALAGLPPFDADGTRLFDSSVSASVSARPLYAETFAPLLDFGWSPLRTIRADGWKYIAAPTPELYDLGKDPGETRNVVKTEPARAAALARQVDAIGPATISASAAAVDRDSLARLQSLGYAAGHPANSTDRPDPKDRRELAGLLARVTSGELQGPILERTLREILRADPRNPQANVRLGYVLLGSDRCVEAVRRFDAAIAGGLPGADAHLGRAACETASKRLDAAARTLSEAEALEPDNPVVIANLGLVLSDGGTPAAAIPLLQRALTIDPDLHQARFGLAIAYARTGRREDAANAARELLRRIPPDAPQRSEIERLLAELR